MAYDLAALKRPILQERSAATLVLIARASADPRSFDMRDRVAAAVWHAHYGFFSFSHPLKSLALMFWSKNDRIEYERQRADRLLRALDELGFEIRDLWREAPNG
jgi:hypothetical protein